MRVGIILEQTRRCYMEFDATEDELAMLENGKNPFQDEMECELNAGSFEYDYTVDDMEGRTLVDWGW